ncbi:MAG: uroporphyrinogen-III C-methyltransferase [Planctomycetota bacterium]
MNLPSRSTASGEPSQPNPAPPHTAPPHTAPPNSAPRNPDSSLASDACVSDSPATDSSAAESPAVRAGVVYLVGAGPGDPGLITVRGLELLRLADVVFYDYLVNPGLLEHVRSNATLFCLGKHGRTVLWSQEEINAQMVKQARLGRVVVRLKGGDPVIFGRIVEETACLAEAGIPFEIVPGVTAALAASSYAGIPLTHREVPSAVAFVTGHEDDDKTGSSLDFASLAKFPGTLVFYMGVTTAPRWTSELMSAGMAPDTPAAIVRRCSLPDQQLVVTTLAQLTEHLVPATKMRPPVIVILGAVVRCADQLAWFHRRPLFGQTVLVTRPQQTSGELVQRLRDLGAEVLTQPAIEILPPEHWQAVDDVIQRLAEFDDLVFASRNGVQFFLERLFALGRDVRQLHGPRIIAVGAGTAAALREYHLVADAAPQDSRAEGLVELLVPGAAGKRFLLVRANRGRDLLAEALLAAGGMVEQVAAYLSRDVTKPDESVAHRLRVGEVAATTVTSSASARALHQLFGDALQQTRLISMSAVTTQTLRELGCEPAAEASEQTNAGLIEALMRSLNH